MCEVLDVSKSGFYKWRKRQKKEATERQNYRNELKQVIVQVFHQNFGVYGSPRIHEALLDLGYKVCERTVGRYMQELGLSATLPKKYKATTDSKHTLPVYDNLLNQDFETDEVNKVWVSDITYVWTPKGWLYLAAILDIYSRKVVGFEIDDNMRKEVPLNALNHAIRTRKPEEGLIHHSDRGSQYASNDYVNALEAIDANISMSRKGNPYDNACCESFFATLKKEFIYRRDFQSKEEAIQGIAWYISFYNKKRKHSSNGYLSPEQFETKEMKPKAPSTVVA